MITARKTITTIPNYPTVYDNGSNFHLVKKKENGISEKFPKLLSPGRNLLDFL